MISVISWRNFVIYWHIGIINKKVILKIFSVLVNKKKGDTFSPNCPINIIFNTNALFYCDIMIYYCEYCDISTMNRFNISLKYNYKRFK